MSSKKLTAVLGLLAALALSIGAAGAGAAANPIYQSPGIPPPGANDPSCRPSDEHPYPVVLVHGTFEDMTSNWLELSPKLVADGYCVFALDYGRRATGRIQHSARELRRFVNHVLHITGAPKVALVGHSQGGMMPRWYIKFLGGKRTVNELVGLAPSNHGTDTPLAGPAGENGCPACGQQAAGSKFLQKLNAGDETPGRVSYTQIETQYDEVVTPFESAFLAEGPRTTNVLLQDDCPADTSEHLTIPFDPIAIQWVENALGRSGPADPSFTPVCG
jgi:triacylglycerol lipase